MSTKLPLPGLTQVEQTSVKNFINDVLSKKKAHQIIQQNAQTLMDEYDHKESIKMTEHKKIQLQTSHYLLNQIAQKKQKQLSASELSKRQYNHEYEALPENQVCPFPKITEQTPYERALEKFQKQQLLSQALNEQITLKKTMESNQSMQDKIEHENNSHLREIYTQEVNNKRARIKELQKLYKEELDKLVNEHKSKVEDVEIPQLDTQDAAGENKNKDDEESNEKFENLEENTHTITEQANAQECKRSHSVDNRKPIDDNEYSKVLLQKIENYQTRTASKKSYYNIEKLRALLLKSNGFVQNKSNKPFLNSRYYFMQEQVKQF